MKKIISSTLFAITLLSITHCSPQKKVINREVGHSQHGKMLLGLQSLSQFEKAPFNTWYSQEKSEYQLDSNPPILPYGRVPNQANRRGIAPGGLAARAGILNAQPWPTSTWVNTSTCTLAATI